MKTNMPIVWTIAGSDSGGGAGIQADLLTFHDLNTHGCSVITAVTAQNSVAIDAISWTSAALVSQQIATLEVDLYPQAIKIGMIGSVAVMQAILPFLLRFQGSIIIDPVMVSSSGARLFESAAEDFFIRHLLPCANLLTPNLHEAAVLSQQPLLATPAQVIAAANYLLSLGAKSILIKEGHHDRVDYAQDYWTDGNDSFYLTIEKRIHSNNHGSGCTLSAAITAALALGFTLSDSLVLAKAYVSQGLRLARQFGQGPGPVAHKRWPKNSLDLPWLTSLDTNSIDRPHFLPCSHPLGLYPLVDSAAWVEKMLSWGVKTIQLRIKHKTGLELEQEISRAIALAKAANAQLFINDYWRLAIKYAAYGVHLGQEDLRLADSNAIARAKLRLGISVHCYTEISRAHALRPSYVAVGPIFTTQSKQLNFLPLGLAQLAQWCAILPYPVVAIGGIGWEELPAVLATGVDGVAVISAWQYAADPKERLTAWMQVIKASK